MPRPRERAKALLPKVVKLCRRAACTAHKYRDKLFIRKDIILTLAEYGRLNVTSLATYCGLNMIKHRPLLDDLEEKGIISSTVERAKGRRITHYAVTAKGLEFCSRVLSPYEEMFPRKGGGGEKEGVLTRQGQDGTGAEEA